MRFERRVLWLSLMTGVVGTAVSLFYIGTSPLSIETKVTLGILIVGVWLGFAFHIRAVVAFPLRTLSNLMGALREGDYALRARGASQDDAMGEAVWELNALAESLREQRLGAAEATALLRRVMAQIDVAVFGFDAERRLRLVNESGRQLLGKSQNRAFWPEGGAVGKTVFWGDPLTVVGVVHDLRNARRNLPARAVLYLSMNQQLWSAMTIVIRYDGRVDALIPAIRHEAQAIDPEVPIFNVQTMSEMVSGASAQARFSTWLLGVFAVGALMLALVGLYGVTSCVVAERTHEFGVRVALGALPGDVRRLVFRQHLAILVVGLLVGAAASLAGLLYEIHPTDFATFAGAAVVLALVSSLAVWVPARRAIRVDPMEALRCE